MWVGMWMGLYMWVGMWMDLYVGRYVDGSVYVSR